MNKRDNKFTYLFIIGCLLLILSLLIKNEYLQMFFKPAVVAIILGGSAFSFLIYFIGISKKKFIKNKIYILSKFLFILGYLLAFCNYAYKNLLLLKVLAIISLLLSVYFLLVCGGVRAIEKEKGQKEKRQVFPHLTD